MPQSVFTYETHVFQQFLLLTEINGHWFQVYEGITIDMTEKTLLISSFPFAFRFDYFIPSIPSLKALVRAE